MKQFEAAKEQSFVEIIYSLLVEAIAAFDLITDIFVVWQFFRLSKQFYASIMVLSMIAPYLGLF